MDSPQFKDQPMNGKDSADSINAARGFQPRHGETGVIKVQPPRREDLQPSYAQMLQ